MSKAVTGEKRRNGRVWFILLCVLAFLVSFAASAVFKLVWKDPALKKYNVQWSDRVGTVHADLPYGEKPANRFDLYVPADNTRESYGLVVYLHAGGFTSGDKTDDAEMLQWLCSLGYVSAGINYTLSSEENPDANVYTQSMEIKEAMPYVIKAADDFGYPVDRMALAGGSAGGCLALIYAYRDADTAPVPVRMVFEAVGPSSFYPEDWKCYGLDKDSEAAAGLFSVMTGREIDPALFGTPEYDELVKDVSALLWVDKNTVPSVLAYGKHDTIQPYDGAVRLDAALTAHGVPHEFIVLVHSGHGLQNDNARFAEYMEKTLEYLERYMGQ